MDGVIVSAKAGHRDQYKKLNSKLCPSSDPEVIIKAMQKKTNANVIYISDLDAIEHNTAQYNFIKEILEFTESNYIWLDAGFRSLEDYEKLLEKIGCVKSKFVNAANRIVPVFGTETVKSLKEAKMIFDEIGSAVLSIDKRNNSFLDVANISANYQVWPRSIILMNLDSVGMNTGPDIEWLREVRAVRKDVKIFGAGGVRNSSDCELVESFGAAGWLCSTVIHQGKKLI